MLKTQPFFLSSNQPHHWIGLAGQREQRAVCFQKWATPSLSSLSICLAPGHLPGDSNHTWNLYQLEIPGNTSTMGRICFVTIFAVLTQNLLCCEINFVATYSLLSWKNSTKNCIRGEKRTIIRYASYWLLPDSR